MATMDEGSAALEAAVLEVARELGVEPRPASGADADAMRFERDGVLFAVGSPGRLEVRIPADIGEAALRTPDTRTSDRGAGWVSLEPRTGAAHVGDRARAWMTTAWRHAAPGAGERRGG
jgi:hypothetical protein